MLELWHSAVCRRKSVDMSIDDIYAEKMIIVYFPTCPHCCDKRVGDREAFDPYPHNPEAIVQYKLAIFSPQEFIFAGEERYSNGLSGEKYLH